MTSLIRHRTTVHTEPDRGADWRERAACRDYGPDLWHEPDVLHGQRRETASERRDREQAAKWVCARCPVREQCLDEALDRDPYEQHGVWGGLDAGERRGVLKRRGITNRGHGQPNVDETPDERIWRVSLSDPQLRHYHARHIDGEGTRWVVLGEREYRKRRKREQREGA